MPGEEDDLRPETQLRAFLLSDIRGFSSFSAARGAEAAAALTRRFGQIATDVITAHGGQVVDQVGDEVLAAFDSPRKAIRAAIEYQERMVRATRENPSLPLPCGVGLDFGEAVLTPNGWSANAINVSARLCSLALGGEILATAELAHIAQAMDGVTYETRPAVSVKGIPQPVRRVRIIPDGADAVAELVQLGYPRAAPLPSTKRRRAPLGAGAVAADIAVVATGLVLTTRNDDDGRVDLHADVLGVLDTAGHVQRQVDVGDAPGAVAVDRAAAWVVNTTDDTVTRIDAEDRSAPANTIKVGAGAGAVALGEGAAWVANASERTVSRINPGRVPSVGDTITVGNGPSAVAVGYGSVWVANLVDGTVSVIDPNGGSGRTTDSVIQTIQVGASPSAIALGQGSVWVANSGSSTVSRIDPETMSVTASINVGSGPRAIAVGNGAVWVANGLDDTVSRIDPATGGVSDVVKVGDLPSGVATTGGRVWVTNSNDDSVSEIDSADRRVDRTIRLHAAPQAVASHAGRVWLSARGPAALHRGGTLKIVANHAAESLDPAVGYGVLPWSISSLTSDGLLTYQRSGGPLGATVTPDLAQKLPTSSDAGKTYSFQLRRGIRYSTGELVKASDVRTSLERTLRLSPVASYYSAILGSATCLPPHAAGCDLSRGVVTDDTAGTVVLHLGEADPDLLYKLALPFAAVLPSGTAVKDTGFGPRSGTGPYVLRTSSAARVVLTRNPHFHEWSPLAQPAGYPDRIEISLTAVEDDVAAHRDGAAVATGRADWTPDGLLPEDLAELVRTRTAQLHPYEQNSVHYYFLNTTMAPFTDVRVRRAVNLAVDRTEAAASLGGPLTEVPTCQVMTPSITGYRPYCPYTLKPEGNVWSAPDLASAKALIRDAGANGAPVTLVTSTELRPAALVINRAMRSIGLNSKVKVIAAEDGDYYEYIGDQSHHVQAALEGWSVDYPGPSALIGQLLRCSSRTPKHNLDESLFCDPTVDDRIDEALRLQSSDPAAAGDAWAKIDRSIVDAAPWVPLVTDRGYDVVSQRVGNYQHHPVFGMLLDQVWVQ